MHDKSIQKITGVSYKKSLTEASLGWSCLGRYFKESNQSFYTSKNQYLHQFIPESIHGGRVICLYRKFVSSSFHEIVQRLEKHFGYDLDTSELFEKNLVCIEQKKVCE